MGRNRNVVQGITAWVGKQTPSGGWTWAVPVSCFGCIYFLGDEGAGGGRDGEHEWLAGQEMGKLIVSGGGEVGGLMQSGDDSTGDNRSINR